MTMDDAVKCRICGSNYLCANDFIDDPTECDWGIYCYDCGNQTYGQGDLRTFDECLRMWNEDNK